MNRPDDPDAVVRALLRHPRPASIDAARSARVRPAVHAAWKESAGGTRHTWKWAVAIAAAAVLVFAIALTVENRLREHGDAPAPAPVASALFATSEVEFQHDGQARAGRDGEALMPGTRITTHGGRAAIALADGVELRLDANTDLTLESERRLSLSSGGLYLDTTNRTGPSEPVAIAARGAVIRNIGTRYEVRLSEQELRVRVRDGRVEVSGEFGMREADRGGQLSVTTAGVVAGRAPIAGADWDWIVRAVRPPKLEGRPLPEFLAWAEREGGRPIRFADPALERANAATIVYGVLERLTVEEALDVVLPSCGLARRTDDDVITIVSADNPSAMSGANKKQ